MREPGIANGAARGAGDWRKDELSDSDLEVVVGGLARAWITVPEVSSVPGGAPALAESAPDVLPKAL